MGIFSWIIFGLIAGALAKWIMPGKDPGGLFVTMGIGIAGAFAGGSISSLLGFGSATTFSLKSLAIAIGGALLLLWLYRQYKAKQLTGPAQGTEIDGDG